MSLDPNKEFDGIRQADNPMPGWWVWIFFGCVLFAGAYVVYFHGFSSWGQFDSYKNELKAHDDKFPKKSEVIANADGTNPLRGNKEAVEEGKKTFGQFCGPCHGADAKGVVGPDLTDKAFLWGKTDKEQFTVIMEGVMPDKAKTGKGMMPAHKGSLGSEKVYQILAWIAEINPALKSK